MLMNDEFKWCVIRRCMVHLWYKFLKVSKYLECQHYSNLLYDSLRNMVFFVLTTK